MIKRRYYKSEHGDGNEASSASSSSSSSDSDSEVEAEPTIEPGSPPSGYESEDSSVAEEIGADSSDEDDSAGKAVREQPWLSSANMHSVESLEKELILKLMSAANNKPIAADLPSHVLKLKSVYRCRICPKVICLNEETMRAHVNSKKHARSEKLLKENKLREMLNDHGEIENQETAAELHARVVALAEENPKGKKKRQRGGSMDKEKPKMKKERPSAGSTNKEKPKRKKKSLSAGSMDKEKPKRKKERLRAGSMDKEVGDNSNKKRKADGLKSNPIKRKRKNGSRNM